MLALTRCGRLFAWGNNEYGQIWTVNDNLQVSEPVELPLDQCAAPPEAGDHCGRVSIKRPSSIACAGSMCSLIDEEGYVSALRAQFLDSKLCNFLAKCFDPFASGYTRV